MQLVVSPLTVRQRVRQLAYIVRELDEARAALRAALVTAREERVSKVELAELMDLTVDELTDLLAELQVLEEAS